MREIFERAENVIVWLGEDTGDANEAFKILRAIDPSSSELSIVDLIRTERGKALRKLLERSWFRRIWIVQELIRARSATIKCGIHSMEWETFLDIAERLRYTGYYAMTLGTRIQDALHVLGNMRQYRQRRKLMVMSDLEALLYDYRGCQASNPRDKLFALVGIAHGQIAAAYNPDYSRDVLEVYRNLAIHLIIAERNPDFLTHCDYIVGSQAPLLQSWVPDWSQPLHINPSLTATPNAYKASAGTSSKGRVSEDLGELYLDGILLSKVEVLGGTGEWRSLRFDMVKQAKRDLERNEEYLDMFRQSPCYRGCYWSAFPRALVADRDHTGSRVGQRDLSEAYVTYRKYSSWILLLGATSRHTFWKECAEVEHDEVHEFAKAINYASYGRNFCIFDDGRAGWVPQKAEVGD